MDSCLPVGNREARAAGAHRGTAKAGEFADGGYYREIADRLRELPPPGVRKELEDFTKSYN
jgi:hypothetical protein